MIEDLSGKNLFRNLFFFLIGALGIEMLCQNEGRFLGLETRLENKALRLTNKPGITKKKIIRNPCKVMLIL